jgi:glycosyltransferase involved in cell wall biosynthesis
MRILVISDLYPPVSFGGYELECAALVGGLRSRHEVFVLTSDREARKVPAEEGIWRTLPYVGASRLQALRAPWAALAAARATRDALGRARPELVYVSNCAAVPHTAPLVAAEEHPAPVLYRFSERWFAASIYRGDRFLRHLLPGDRGLRAAWARALRAANRHPRLRLDPARPAPAAISWASEGLRRAVELPPAIEPVLERIIHPASDHAADYAALPRRPLPVPTVAYVGRLTEAKGVEVAVRALARLRQDHAIPALLVLAGPYKGPARRAVEELAGRLGVGDAVEIRGPQTHEAVGRLLSEAGVVLVPSVEHEAFPLVCVEAALARAPVVASQLGGIPEALPDGTHAVLFPPGDEAACAAALAQTFNDPAAAQRRAARAFEHARSLTLERYVAESQSYVEEVTGALRSHPATAPAVS